MRCKETQEVHKKESFNQIKSSVSNLNIYFNIKHKSCRMWWDWNDLNSCFLLVTLLQLNPDINFMLNYRWTEDEGQSSCENKAASDPEEPQTHTWPPRQTPPPMINMLVNKKWKTAAWNQNNPELMSLFSDGAAKTRGTSNASIITLHCGAFKCLSRNLVWCVQMPAVSVGRSSC